MEYEGFFNGLNDLHTFMAHTDKEGGGLNLNFLSHPPTRYADPARDSPGCFSLAASSTAERPATDRYAKTPHQGYPATWGAPAVSAPTPKVSGDTSRDQVTTSVDGGKLVTFAPLTSTPSARCHSIDHIR